MPDPSPRATKPAVLVYCFAGAASTTSDSDVREAHDYLRLLWRSCGRLGMTEGIPDLGAPTGFPDDLESLSSVDGFQLLAARTRPSEEAQQQIVSAFLFVEHDTLALFAIIAPNEDRDLSGWRDLYESWRRETGGQPPPEQLIGEVFLFQALCDGASATEIPSLFGSDVKANSPFTSSEPWEQSFSLTRQGFTLWEVPDESHGSGIRRVLCLLSPADEATEDAVSAWIWTPLPAPFGRYLLHSMKLRYEGRVYRRMRRVDRLRLEVEAALEELTRVLDTGDDPLAIPTSEILRAQLRLSRAETQQAGLLVARTQLRELGQTVEIAERNFERRSPEIVREYGGSPFERDRDLAQWLKRQTANDLTYLDATRERARGLQALAASRVDEVVREHQTHVTTLQTSLLSALLMALGVIEAGQVTVELGSLAWPLIAVLSTLALALPIGIVHWSPALQSLAAYRAWDYATIAAFGGSIGWFLLALVFELVSEEAPPWVVSVAAFAIGAAVFWFATRSWDERQRLRARGGEAH